MTNKGPDGFIGLKEEFSNVQDRGVKVALGQQIVITLDGKPFEVNQVSQLPLGRIAGLLVNLASLQTAIAAHLWSGPTTSEQNAQHAPNAAKNVHEGRNQVTIHDTEPRSTKDFYLDLKQTAERTGLSRSTLYHWIENGRLDEARGLRRFGGRRLIDWQVFQTSLIRGDLE